jgi:hypothetical protein
VGQVVNGIAVHLYMLSKVRNIFNDAQLVLFSICLALQE